MFLGIKRIFACLGLCTITIAGFCLYRSMQSATYTITADEIFSADMSTRLSEFVAHRTDLHPRQLCDQLKEQFSAVQKCTARLYADGTCTISIIAKKPLVKLSSDVIITHDGASTELALWDEQAIHQLATIDVKQSLTVADGQALAAYIKNIPADYFEQYDISWHNKHEISFYDKQRKLFFLSDITTFPDEQLRQSFAEIISGMGTMPTQKQKQLVADIRFEHQLIIYEKRGAYHGNSIL